MMGYCDECTYYKNTQCTKFNIRTSGWVLKEECFTPDDWVKKEKEMEDKPKGKKKSERFWTVMCTNNNDTQAIFRVRAEAVADARMLAEKYKQTFYVMSAVLKIEPEVVFKETPVR